MKRGEVLAALGGDLDPIDPRSARNVADPGREVALVQDEERRHSPTGVEEGAILVGQGLASIQDEENKVAALRRLPRSAHPLRFDPIRWRAQARRVDQANGHAADRRHLFDGVARRPRNRRHDRPLFREERVQERRLAHVGAPEDHDRQPFADDASPLGAGEEIGGASRDGLDAGSKSVNHDIEIGEVDLHFEVGEDRGEIVAQRGDRLRKPAAEAVDGRFEPEARLRAHDVRDGLGLVERDAAVEVGALRELAALGEASAAGEQRVEDSARGHDAAVAAQLDHILARVGARRTHDRGQNLVDSPAVVVDVSVVDRVCRRVGKTNPLGRDKDEVGDLDRCRPA